jgi:large subunit ribosomal protein L20
VKGGVTARRRHRSVLEAVKGHRAARSRRIKAARESLLHAMAYATAHRREKKRERRALAILRINAAARASGLTYRQLVHGLRLANVDLDRQSLAELAIGEPQAFAEVVNAARAALPA